VRKRLRTRSISSSAVAMLVHPFSVVSAN